MKKKCAVNKGFLLYKQESNTFSLYKVICKKIPISIFTKLGYNFFESLVENNIINVFYIKKQNKLASIITVVNYENFNVLKKKIATKENLEQINKNIISEIKEAADYALESPYPESSELYTNVYL